MGSVLLRYATLEPDRDLKSAAATAKAPSAITSNAPPAFEVSYGC